MLLSLDELEEGFRNISRYYCTSDIELLDIPSTGKKVTFWAIENDRFAGGKFWKAG